MTSKYLLGFLVVWIHCGGSNASIGGDGGGSSAPDGADGMGGGGGASGYLVTPISTTDDMFWNSSDPTCDPANLGPGLIGCDDFEDGTAVVTCLAGGGDCCTQDPVCNGQQANAGEAYAPNDGFRGDIFVTWPQDDHGYESDSFTTQSGAICAKPGSSDRGFRSACSMRYAGNGRNAPGPAPNGSPWHGKFNPAAYHQIGGPRDTLYVSFFLKVGANAVTGEEFAINNANVKMISLTDALDGGAKYFLKMEPRADSSFGLYLEAGWPDNPPYPPEHNTLVYSMPHSANLSRDRWYAVQFMYKIQAQDPAGQRSNGAAALWVNDCGADSLGCLAGTQRALVGELTDLDFGDASERFWQVWPEWWENNRGTGDRYIDDFQYGTESIPIRGYYNN